MISFTNSIDEAIPYVKYIRDTYILSMLEFHRVNLVFHETESI